MIRLVAFLTILAACLSLPVRCEPLASSATGVDLFVDVDVSEVPLADPELPFQIELVFANLGRDEATAARIDVELGAGLEVRNLPGLCSPSIGGFTCDLGSVPGVPQDSDPEFRRLEFEVVPPPGPGGESYLLRMEVSASEADANSSNNTREHVVRVFQTFYVTSSSDSGPGSLREAINGANEECGAPGECKVAFRITPSDHAQWETIRPLSDLPTLHANGTLVDGSTQTAFFGDRNPFGPEIELNGDSQIDGVGDGLTIASDCGGVIRDLTIGGFRRAGVLVYDSPNPCTFQASKGVRVHRCHVGSDPTGMEQRPNRFGVVVAARVGIFGGVEIINNIIGGNLRSGILALNGRTLIEGNRIGINRDLSAPLSNGASGVYASAEAAGTHIVDNHIAFNHDFGVGVESGGRWVAVEANSIHANWQGGIDLGLDGITEAIALFPGSEPTFVVPVINSASYDSSADTTTIKGSLPDLVQGVSIPSGGPNRVRVYANDAPGPSGFGEGQYFLGVAQLDDHDFTLEVDGDLTGKWVSATVTFTHIWGFKGPASEGLPYFWSTTSEFSRSVQVAP